MKANEYQVMEDCVERGIAYGYQRAYKYADKPSDQVIKDEIERAVMLEISGYFSFNFDYGDD